MNISNLKRNPSAIKEKLAVDQNGRTVALAKLKIMIPSKFENYGLLSFGSDTNFLGFYCIFDEEGNYAIDCSPTMLRTTPTHILRENINGKEYMIFSYSRGDVIIKDSSVFIDDTKSYDVFNFILSTGDIPWWMNYEDVAKMFSKDKRFTGIGFTSNLTTVSIIVATLARSKEDPSKQYRVTVTDKKMVTTNPPSWSALRNVFYTANNTIAKISGSFFTNGVISAINNPTEILEKSDYILRK